MITLTPTAKPNPLFFHDIFLLSLFLCFYIVNMLVPVYNKKINLRKMRRLIHASQGRYAIAWYGAAPRLHSILLNFHNQCRIIFIDYFSKFFYVVFCNLTVFLFFPQAEVNVLDVILLNHLFRSVFILIVNKVNI